MNLSQLLSKLTTDKWETTKLKESRAKGKYKIGIAIYYKNLSQYPKEWITKCAESIKHQTYNDFDVYVLNYGEKIEKTFAFMAGNSYHFLHKPMKNYAEAINTVYEKIFETCDIAVNTNIDDYYSEKRIEVLLAEIENGADIASSNVRIINDKGQVTYSHRFHKSDVYKSLLLGYNPVSNPAHIMKKRVFQKLKFDSTLVPAEDLVYWTKAIEKGFKISISKEYLHFYRNHPGQSTHRGKK